MVVCFSCIWAGSNWFGWFGRSGGDRLSRTLRCSIIGAGVFHGRVRDGIGWIIPRHGHQIVRASLSACATMCWGWCALLCCVRETECCVLVVCHAALPVQVRAMPLHVDDCCACVWLLLPVLS